MAVLQSVPGIADIWGCIIAAEIADSPIKNWQGTSKDFPVLSHSRRLAPERIVAHQKRRYHCSSCPLGCGGELEFPPETGIPLQRSHKPEYETCAAFGSMLLNNDLETSVQAVDASTVCVPAAPERVVKSAPEDRFLEDRGQDARKGKEQASLDDIDPGAPGTCHTYRNDSH